MNILSRALLAPPSWLYRGALALRNRHYDGPRAVRSAPVPVVSVGNITVGGTGKTPIVSWIAEQLESMGRKPAIVSRGYGGSKSGTSMRVDVDSDAVVVGDEPVLLARRARCPVVVDSDRVRAAQMLVEDGANVIIADDGLQHLRMHRDFEICVVDGERGFGNRRLLPAGPLRESPERLQTVDQVLINGMMAEVSRLTVIRKATILPCSWAATACMPMDIMSGMLKPCASPRRQTTLSQPFGMLFQICL